MYGRGYSGGGGLGFGPPVTPLIIKQILIANVAVFVAQTIGLVPLQLFAATVATASADDPMDPDARRDKVVPLVLAQDPRFAELPDYDRLRIKASANFDLVGTILSASHYRVVPTLASVYSPWLVDFGYAGNWLVEVHLVAGCTEATGDTAPLPDPCAWRHSWFYRVAPDDTVTLLFEEGDPEPMNAG